MTRLLAISDLHVAHAENLAFVEAIEGSTADWLVLAGDVCERLEDLEHVIDTLAPRFAQLVWVPGNHELWTTRPGELRGEAKYFACVDACRLRGVLTPDNPYAVFPTPGGPVAIVPMFLLYDYSYRPDHVTREHAIEWAREEDTVCADEELLHPTPYPTRDAWCDARVTETARRLDALPAEVGTILVNHFPLRRAHALLPLIPRFSLWCGTTRTEDWPVRYRARAVVSGHLHIPRTFHENGIAFEEVSLGYPKQWKKRRGELIRQVWPRM